MKIHYLVNETCVQVGCIEIASTNSYCDRHFASYLVWKIKDLKRQTHSTALVIMRLAVKDRLRPVK